MLRKVIIMSGAGVLLFEKVWVEDDGTDKGKTLFGSLITTMQEFSRQSTGLLVSFIEFEDLAISIVDDVKTKLICTLFYDSEDGSDFGRIVAAEILRNFIEAFSETGFSGVQNKSIFNTFNAKVFDAIQQAVKTIAHQLQGNRGITSVVVVYDDGTAIGTQQDQDQLGIVANLTPLITTATDTMTAVKDRTKVITVEFSSRYLAVVHRVGEAHLVVVCRKAIKPSIYKSAIEKAVFMLDRVFAVSRSLSLAR